MMSQSHRIEGGTTDEAFQEHCFLWEKGASDEAFKIFDMNKNLYKTLKERR